MKWDKETGLPVPGTCQSKNRQQERLLLSGMYQGHLGTNPVLGSEISSIVTYAQRILGIYPTTLGTFGKHIQCFDIILLTTYPVMVKASKLEVYFRGFFRFCWNLNHTKHGLGIHNPFLKRIKRCFYPGRCGVHSNHSQIVYYVIPVTVQILAIL